MAGGSGEANHWKRFAGVYSTSRICRKAENCLSCHHPWWGKLSVPVRCEGNELSVSAFSYSRWCFFGLSLLGPVASRHTALRALGGTRLLCWTCLNCCSCTGAWLFTSSNITRAGRAQAPFGFGADHFCWPPANLWQHRVIHVSAQSGHSCSPDPCPWHLPSSLGTSSCPPALRLDMQNNIKQPSRLLPSPPPWAACLIFA